MRTKPTPKFGKKQRTRDEDLHVRSLVPFLHALEGNCIIAPPTHVAVISGPWKSRMVIGEW